MKLAGVTRTVADVEKSRRFYEDLLGFGSRVCDLSS